MTELIDHIDQIARQKRRHVAGIFFEIDEMQEINKALAHVETLRTPIVNWLDQEGIVWTPCFDFFDGNIDPFYKGDIYVEMEIDPEHQQFSELTKMLENDDETPRIAGVSFKFFRYEDALENEQFYRDCLENI